MVLHKPTKEEYSTLGADLKELKKLNAKVKMQLTKVCGKRYSELLVRHENDLEQVSLTLEGKMNQDYPGCKAEAMKIFYSI